MKSSNSGEEDMRKSTPNFRQVKARALARPGVRKAYDALREEFVVLDNVLKSRTIEVSAANSGAKNPK